MKKDTFQCYECEKIFPLLNNEEWNKQKANEEYEKEFKIEKETPTVMLCAVCYSKMMEFVNTLTEGERLALVKEFKE